VVESLAIVLLGRPYVVTGGLIKCSWCFFSPRVLRFPSTDRPETLPPDRNLRVFYNASPKIRGHSPQKYSRVKNMLNFGRFWTTSDFEYLRNGPTYQKSENVTNYGNSFCVWWQKSGELWSANGLELHVSLDPLKCTFWQTVFQPIGGAAPRKFYTR